MPIRAYRISFPVLIEDVANPRALAVQEKLSVIVEAQNPLEAKWLLEHAWGERLPIGFTFMSQMARRPLHLFTRIHWLEPNETGGERIHRYLDGRYEGVDRERGTLLFSMFMDFDQSTGGVHCVMGTQFPIPFDNVVNHDLNDWEHAPFEGLADDQVRMEVHVSGYFEFTTHEEYVLNVPTAYVAVAV